MHGIVCVGGGRISNFVVADCLEEGGVKEVCMCVSAWVRVLPSSMVLIRLKSFILPFFVVQMHKVTHIFIIEERKHFKNQIWQYLRVSSLRC